MDARLCALKLTHGRVRECELFVNACACDSVYESGWVVVSVFIRAHRLVFVWNYVWMSGCLDIGVFDCVWRDASVRKVDVSGNTSECEYLY